MRPPNRNPEFESTGSIDAGGIPRLLDLIRAEIRSDGPISFARFMEQALYAPGLGYYARGERAIGPAGDFVTASDEGQHFGRCLARQLAEIDRLTGPLDPFRVVEFGAGRGWLARDILDHLAYEFPELRARVGYEIVDRASAMREAASSLVPEAAVGETLLRRSGSAGCAIAVELFDALPVRRLRRRNGELVEIRVGLGASGELLEVEKPAGRELVSLADRCRAATTEGSEAEFAPTLSGELARMADAIDRGIIIIVDYGDVAERLYTRRRGTLLAYHRQTTNEQYLSRVGLQDLTAHVNFTALEEAARSIGLELLGRTTQDRFLIGNGILKIFDETDPVRWGDPRNVQQRLQVMQLIHPSTMGRSFRVVIFAKNLTELPRLQGLEDPFAREASPES